MKYQLYTNQKEIRQELKSFLKNRLYVPTWMAKSMLVGYLNQEKFGVSEYIIDRVATAYYNDILVAWVIRLNYSEIESKNLWRFTRRSFRKQGISSTLVSIIKDSV